MTTEYLIKDEQLRETAESLAKSIGLSILTKMIYEETDGTQEELAQYVELTDRMEANLRRIVKISLKG